MDTEFRNHYTAALSGSECMLEGGAESLYCFVYYFLSCSLDRRCRASWRAELAVRAITGRYTKLVDTADSLDTWDTRAKSSLVSWSARTWDSGRRRDKDKQGTAGG